MSPLRPIACLCFSTGLLLLGCRASAAPTDPPRPAPAALAKPDAEGRLELALSGKAEIGPGLLLTLENVVSDSRCPVDVTCVWAGEIRIALAVDPSQGEGARSEFELATTAPKATVRGLDVELLGAEPAPHSKKPIAPADYRISLRVSRASADGTPPPSPGAS